MDEIKETNETNQTTETSATNQTTETSENTNFSAFSPEEIKKKLASMGLSPEEINQKLASMGLSPEEINQKLLSTGISLDDITRKIGSLGLPGIIFTIAVSASGATAYPTIFGLAALGGPLGIVGGLGLLGLTTIIGDVLTGYGIEAVLTSIYKERRKNETQESLLKEVEGLPISVALKLHLKQQIEVEIAPEIPTVPRTVEIVE